MNWLLSLERWLGSENHRVPFERLTEFVIKIVSRSKPRIGQAQEKLNHVKFPYVQAWFC